MAPLLGNDKIMLCLAAALAPIFNILRQAPFCLNQREKLFLGNTYKSLPANIFGNFLFDSPSFITAILT